METKTHWKQLIDPRFIGAYALPNGSDITVKIVDVKLENIVIQGGKKEDHTIAYLRNQKPLILNMTNSKTLHRLYGPYIEDWIGKDITLFASVARLGNEDVECIRIRPTAPSKERPRLSEERFAKALTQIKAGNYKIENMKQFALTARQQKQLKAVLIELTSLKEPSGE